MSFLADATLEPSSTEVLQVDGFKELEPSRPPASSSRSMKRHSKADSGEKSDFRCFPLEFAKLTLVRGRLFFPPIQPLLNRVYRCPSFCPSLFALGRNGGHRFELLLVLRL